MATSSAVKCALKNGVAVLHITSPPVNALGAAVRAGLVAGVEHAIGASATGLVVAGGGSTFPAGADITEFSKPHVPPSFAEVMAAFEDAPFPTAAAIHGTALGGGFELAMACHYRAMGERARVGLPEVHLGLLPGAGGTQRLPRLVGADAALEMMLTGAPIGAERALALGAVDVVVPEAGLEAAAVELVTTRAARRAHAVVVDGFRDAAKRAALEARAALPAPRAILRCVDAAVGSELAAGLEVEGREFQALKATPEARALQHLFFAERACAKVPGVDAKGAAPLDAVGVVGGGTMGRGIAMCFLDAGLPVTLVDVDDTAAAAAAAGPDSVSRIMNPLVPTDVRERRLAKFRQNVARFRLYRLRFLQVNMRSTAFFKIYQILKLNFLKFDKILQILRHLHFCLLKFHENCCFLKPIFCENFEIAAVQKDANLVELEKCCRTHIFLQNFVLIQSRTSPPKICKILKNVLENLPISLTTAPRLRSTTSRVSRKLRTRSTQKKQFMAMLTQ